MDDNSPPEVSLSHKRQIAALLQDGVAVYVHRATGAFLAVHVDPSAIKPWEISDEEEALRQTLEAHPDAFILIDPPASYLSYNWMKDFASRLPAGATQHALLDCLSHRSPFTDFLAYLHTSAPAGVLAQWNQFKDGRLIDHLDYELASADKRNAAFADLDEDDMPEVLDEEEDEDLDEQDDDHDTIF